MTAEVEAEVAISPARRNLVIAGLMLGMALPAIDLLIVATAASDISADLGELGDFAWLFIGYQLTLVLAMLVFGKLGDLYGHRQIFMAFPAMTRRIRLLTPFSLFFTVIIALLLTFSRTFFRPGAIELAFPLSQFCFQLLIFLYEFLLPLFGFPVHFPPVTGFRTKSVVFSQMGATGGNRGRQEKSRFQMRRAKKKKKRVPALKFLLLLRCRYS